MNVSMRSTLLLLALVIASCGVSASDRPPTDERLAGLIDKYTQISIAVIAGRVTGCSENLGGSGKIFDFQLEVEQDFTKTRAPGETVEFSWFGGCDVEPEAMHLNREVPRVGETWLAYIVAREIHGEEFAWLEAGLSVRLTNGGRLTNFFGKSPDEMRQLVSSRTTRFEPASLRDAADVVAEGEVVSVEPIDRRSGRADVGIAVTHFHKGMSDRELTFRTVSIDVERSKLHVLPHFELGEHVIVFLTEDSDSQLSLSYDSGIYAKWLIDSGRGYVEYQSRPGRDRIVQRVEDVDVVVGE